MFPVGLKILERPPPSFRPDYDADETMALPEPY